MKLLRPLVCRCLLALLPWAWTPPAAAAPKTAMAKSVPSAAAKAKAGAGQAHAHQPPPRSRGAARHAGVRKGEVAKPLNKRGATARAAGGAAGAKPSPPGRSAANKRAAARAAAAAPSRTGLDFTGRKRVGQASFYARRFAGRRMADGSRMRLNHHNAASKTLPLGTIAKVTNLKTGRSAVVKIQDRGPFVRGRIVDLSPATARAVGLTAEEGVAPVEVTPIKVPMPDGSMRLGEAAGDPLASTRIARARDGD